MYQHFDPQTMQNARYEGLFSINFLLLLLWTGAYLMMADVDSRNM